MGGSRFGKFTAAGFGVLILLVMGMMLSNGLRRSSRITLPEVLEPQEEASGLPQGGEGAITPVAVTPETVHLAIESLQRPERYRRTVTVERFWAGGSGASEATVAVSDGWTRTDMTTGGQPTRHSLTNGETTYIWYGNQTEVFHSAAAGISPDEEQGLPTYEAVLALPVNQIETADYRAVSGVNCIYVETGEDERGYALRYWVSVETGLLFMAEWLENGVSIYRMTSTPPDAAGPATEDFTLPTGEMLAGVE